MAAAATTARISDFAAPPFCTQLGMASNKTVPTMRLRSRKPRKTVLQTRAIANLSRVPGSDCHPAEPVPGGPRHPAPADPGPGHTSQHDTATGISTCASSNFASPASPTPSPRTSAPSTPAFADDLELEATDDMLNPSSVRGRNEDLEDLEEKGLLISGGPDATTAIELEAGGSTPRRRAKGESGTYEKLDLGVKPEAGLKSKRDQQAFALLVVLCE